MGERVLKSVAPGQTMRLTPYGRRLFKRLKIDLRGAVKEMDENKAHDIVGESFVEVIGFPFVSRNKPVTTKAGV